MTSLRKKQLTAVLALAVAGSALAYIAMGDIEKNLVYYWDVTQLLEKGEDAYGASVRLGGVVQKGSLDWKPESLALRFRVAMKPEGDPQSVLVSATGAPPQMFREGIGVVLEGRYDGREFTADRVLVKHSNEYQPPKDGERPQDLYGLIKEAQ